VLDRNQLGGEIPPELGMLAGLEGLSLRDNRLTGPIPRELGQLAELRELYLDGNRLTGGVPAELGELSNLERLWLQGNPLSGALPMSLIQLELEAFRFDGTELCAPEDAGFAEWLRRIPEREVGGFPG